MTPPPRWTPDFRSEAANKLAELFPEVLADGKIDLEALKTLLAEDAAEPSERFGLFWPGKARAIQAAQTPTSATLAPDRENSVDWDNTQNVFIEGDNLEVLKILQKHYYGQIKMIYIDPPYNTGKDFVYKDDYSDPLGSYLKMTGQADGEGRLSTNTESDGRFHSNWLNMIYPRLKLSKTLLRQDGCMVMSIGDEEFHEARFVLNEIFGESNYVGTFSVIRAEGGGLAKNLIKGHDYAVVYARNIQAFRPLLRPKDIRGKREIIDGEEYWIEEDWLRKEFGKYGTCMYEDILTYYDQRKLDEINDGLADGRYILIPKGNQHVVGRYRKVSEDGSKFYSVIKHLNKDGKNELEALGQDLSDSFDYPKPTSLIESFISGATFGSGRKAEIILDFFAGSGTTAHAVMKANAIDTGNRRFISVQLPEPVSPSAPASKYNFTNIAEISRERVRRAGTKILTEESEKLDGKADSLDVGFRAYRLVDTNFSKWNLISDISADDLQQQLELNADSSNNAVAPEWKLTELLLKLGLSLTEKIELVTIDGLEVFSVADGLLLAYTQEEVKPSLEQLRALVTARPAKLIILEDAFQGDDELKTNLTQECRAHGVDLYTA